MAKAINNASIPMSQLPPSAKFTIRSSAPAAANAIELFHGYTYSAHPTAAAACIATQDIYRDEKLFERANSLAPTPSAPSTPCVANPSSKTFAIWG